VQQNVKPLGTLTGLTRLEPRSVLVLNMCCSLFEKTGPSRKMNSSFSWVSQKQVAGHTKRVVLSLAVASQILEAS